MSDYKKTPQITAAHKNFERDREKLYNSVQALPHFFPRILDARYTRLG
jgi:hypothetical protein